MAAWMGYGGGVMAGAAWAVAGGRYVKGSSVSSPGWVWGSWTHGAHGNPVLVDWQVVGLVWLCSGRDSGLALGSARMIEAKMGVGRV